MKNLVKNASQPVKLIKFINGVEITITFLNAFEAKKFTSNGNPFKTRKFGTAKGYKG